ncbi:MAG TPA: FtsW/RodA/SpoVE family cell cycle protein [Ktedonobacteraceae bacterium]|nr:FtsW/RodA/SpoVE family cell cycle protein [Ktedonobacteraceae bacterium]
MFIIPFIILLLIMFQLPLAQYYETQLRSNKSQVPLTLSILPTIHDLIPIIGLIVALFLVNITISFFYPKADQVLLPLAGLMSGIGVMMATRLGPNAGDPNLGTRQLAWVLIGLVACLATLFVLRRMGWLRNYKYIWAALGIFLVALTLIHALKVKNFDSPNHDQLNFGPFSLQPSELLKIIIVIFFAAYLDETTRDVFAGSSRRIGPIPVPPLDKLGVLGLMLGISLLLFLGIRELGLALLIYGIFLTMLYLGSGKISYVVVGLLVFFVLGYIGYLIFGYVRARFAAVTIDAVNWQNWTQATVDYVNSLGGPRQVLEGLIALANGGILGSGIALGHPGFVPVVQSDMIFTGLGEELGLAGLFAIIGIYMLIIYRGYRIAIEASNDFSQLLAAGLTSIFAIQSLVIMAGNMKFLPLTGIPLPFLSYGGSSVIANFIIVGILLRISHNTAMEREGLA